MRSVQRFSWVGVPIWTMRLAALVVVVWGATSTLTGGRLTGAQWRDLVTFGVSQGSVYALVALGYTMVYGLGPGSLHQTREVLPHPPGES